MKDKLEFVLKWFNMDPFNQGYNEEKVKRYLIEVISLIEEEPKIEVPTVKEIMEYLNRPKDEHDIERRIEED